MPYGVPQHTSDYLRSSSGSLAIFAAIRRATLFIVWPPLVELDGYSPKGLSFLRQESF
jgi:hypothetical protein